MCRLNCVGEEKSEYINVGVKKWLKKTVFRCKKAEAKKGYPSHSNMVGGFLELEEFGWNQNNRNGRISSFSSVNFKVDFLKTVQGSFMEISCSHC